MGTLAKLVAIIAFAQAIPLQINYQGKVEVNGVPFDGTGQFKFALANQAGDTYYWTNDGSAPIPPAAPDAAVQLTVKAGQYAVSLGDASLPNMTEIPIAVFNTPGVFLRVWFDDGSTGEQLLAPDRQLTSVPYAYMAESIPDASVTSQKIAPESLLPEHSGRGANIASYLQELAGTEPAPIEMFTVPSGSNFVLTDIVIQSRRNFTPGAGAGRAHGEVAIDMLLTDTSLKRIYTGYYTSYYNNVYLTQPIAIHFDAGFPIPTGATVRCRLTDYEPYYFVELSLSGYHTPVTRVVGYCGLFNGADEVIMGTTTPDRRLVITDIVAQGLGTDLADYDILYLKDGVSTFALRAWWEPGHDRRPNILNLRGGIIIPEAAELRVKYGGHLGITITGYEIPVTP